jgi:hypothetical protein
MAMYASPGVEREEQAVRFHVIWPGEFCSGINVAIGAMNTRV